MKTITKNAIISGIYSSINEQILKFAQNYPINSKMDSSEAPFLMN